MSRISELQRIEGAKTDSGDLFVVVNLADRELGTKNITRRELVNAIQQEPFDQINIVNGFISNTAITSTSFSGGSLFNSTINNPSINIDNFYEAPLGSDDYFIIRNIAGQTVKIAFSDLQSELETEFQKVTKIYVDGSVLNTGTGSYLKPFQTLEEAFEFAQNSEIPIAISVLPGLYKTNGNLALPDNCSIISTNGQYSTTIEMNEGFEEENCILVGSGCYVQGLSFTNQRVDDFDNPSKGFADFLVSD